MLTTFEGLEVPANREARVSVLQDRTILKVLAILTSSVNERSGSIVLLDWTLAAKVVSLSVNTVILLVTSDADLALVKWGHIGSFAKGKWRS